VGRYAPWALKRLCARGAFDRALLGGPSTSPLDGTLVPLLGDIAGQIQRFFTGSDRDAATALLLNARIHDGSAAEPRLQRCALVASQVPLKGYGTTSNCLK
jgi:hypothetical protein